MVWINTASDIALMQKMHPRGYGATRTFIEKPMDAVGRYIFTRPVNPVTSIVYVSGIKPAAGPRDSLNTGIEP